MFYSQGFESTLEHMMRLQCFCKLQTCQKKLTFQVNAELAGASVLASACALHAKVGTAGSFFSFLFPQYGGFHRHGGTKMDGLQGKILLKYA